MRTSDGFYFATEEVWWWAVRTTTSLSCLHVYHFFFSMSVDYRMMTMMRGPGGGGGGGRSRGRQNEFRRFIPFYYTRERSLQPAPPACTAAADWCCHLLSEFLMSVKSRFNGDDDKKFRFAPPLTNIAAAAATVHRRVVHAIRTGRFLRRARARISFVDCLSKAASGILI